MEDSIITAFCSQNIDELLRIQDEILYKINNDIELDELDYLFIKFFKYLDSRLKGDNNNE